MKDVSATLGHLTGERDAENRGAPSVPWWDREGVGARRLLLVMVIPMLAFALQWFFWEAIQPYVWFLFFPAVFFSSWIGGFRGGLVATVLSTALVTYFFIPPSFSFAVAQPVSLVSIIVFVAMGTLFSLSHGKLRTANRQVAVALADAKTANNRLQDANTHITRLYEKTRELDELKTRFFANVSHELRTPLALILGPVGRWLGSGGLDAPLRRDLQVVERNARLLHRHVSDLLDVAKLEAGRMRIVHVRTDLARLVRFVASHFDTLATERGIHLAVETPATLMAEVDAEKCERILLNLLSNAFKFAPANGSVAVQLLAERGRASLRVQDNGPGVPPELRESIFEAFRQGSGPVDRCFAGTGLGLAIVREFVALHGGEVSVTEAPGGGALFTADLPLYAPAGTPVQETPFVLAPDMGRLVVDGRSAADTPNGQDAPPVAAAAPLILVVEDNPDMSAFLATILGGRYRIATARNGEEGRDRALALHPDLIVTDYMMPRLDGGGLVLALRRHRGLDDVPIVVVTARADDALRVKLLQSGAQDCLTKPFSTDELLARVGGLVDKRRHTLAEMLRINAGLQREVLERKRAEAENTRLSGQLQLALNAAHMGWWHYDPATRVASFDARYQEIFGVTAAERPNEEILRLIHPDDLPRVWSAVEAALDPADPKPFASEYRVNRADGGMRWVEAHGQAVFAGEGTDRRATSFVGTVADITARKRTEEDIRQLNATLEQRVAERTGQLEAANRELEAFSYSISHDLRAPLRAVDGFARILIEEHAVPLDAEGRRMLHIVCTEAGRMGRLIDDLLAFSRVSRQVMDSGLIDMERLAQAAFEQCVAGLAGRDIRFVPQAMPPAQGDVALLRQVWTNLLSNAVKYTQHRQPARIEVGGREEGGERIYFVRDNGAGFDMRYAHKLFGVFQRLHSEDEFEGTGVGLALVQRIVHRHGGQVRAEGCLGKGATFHFTLPAERGP